MAEVRNAMADNEVAANTAGAPLDILSEALRVSEDKTEHERVVLKQVNIFI